MIKKWVKFKIEVVLRTEQNVMPENLFLNNLKYFRKISSKYSQMWSDFKDLIVTNTKMWTENWFGQPHFELRIF